MGHTTVRIQQSTHSVLKEIARTEHQTMQAILDKAVEAYRRRVFMEQANAAYEVLRQDPLAWADELAERSAWERTLADGLPMEVSAKARRPAGGRRQPAQERGRTR